mmetsp:Transcript_13093/g.39525  ORF Transcript_13093/g.39525 Transcript_13093/m.39525 type:complete len:461 (+) Transcript_13093:162-1544(+)
MDARVPVARRVALPERSLLDDALLVVELGQEPALAVRVDLLDRLHRPVLEDIDPQSDRAAARAASAVVGPDGARLAVDLRQDAQRHLAVLCAERLQQRGRVVDEEGGAELRAAARERVGLLREPRLRHLELEHRAVRLLQPPKGLEDALLRSLVLRLHDEAAEGDRVRPARLGAERARRVPPALPQVPLEDLGLALLGELADDGEGLDEGGEDTVREAEAELFRAAQRRGLGAGEVREPVRKVKSDVGRVDGVGADAGLEVGEDGGGRRLGLHEPAVVEPDLCLREADGALQLVRDELEGGEKVAVMLEDVPECDVVVGDCVAGPEAEVGCVLGADRRAHQVHLHDVVDRCLHEERSHPVRAHADGAVGPAPQHPRVHHQPLQLRPRRALVEGEPLLLAAQQPEPRAGRGRGDGRRTVGAPVGVHAEAEAALAVDADTREPVHGEERADRPPVLGLRQGV